MSAGRKPCMGNATPLAWLVFLREAWASAARYALCALLGLWLLTPYAANAASPVRDRMVITHQPADARFADRVRAVVDEASPGLIADIGIPPTDTIRIHIAETLHAFRTFTPGAIPDWGEGYAVPDRNLIVLKSPRIDGSAENLREVVIHELAHILLHNAMRSADIPRWLDEGFAMYAAKEWGFWDRTTLTLAVLTDRLVPLQEIHAVNTFSRRKAQLAYHESALTVQFIIMEYGRPGLRTLLKNLRNTGSINAACFATFGMSAVQFEQAWLEFMKREYGWSAFAGELFTSLFWAGMAFLFVLAYLGVRWRRRKILRRWEREETEESTWTLEEDKWNRMRREWERRRIGE